MTLEARAPQRWRVSKFGGIGDRIVDLIVPPKWGVVPSDENTCGVIECENEADATLVCRMLNERDAFVAAAARFLEADHRARHVVEHWWGAEEHAEARGELEDLVMRGSDS